MWQKKAITTLKKRTLKKLVLDTCTKTTFQFNGVLYEQVDGVSMGSSLGPVLANIFLTEFEKKVVNKLIQEKVIPFYMRYVDDTLVLIKRGDIDKVLNMFNNYYPGIKFTHELFNNDSDFVEFLDLKINRYTLETDIHYKVTHTGQYINFLSYTPWGLKISWIRALYYRAKRICSTESIFLEQLSKLRLFMSWNGFPRYVCRKLIKKVFNARDTYTQ